MMGYSASPPFPHKEAVGIELVIPGMGPMSARCKDAFVHPMTCKQLSINHEHVILGTDSEKVASTKFCKPGSDESDYGE